MDILRRYKAKTSTIGSFNNAIVEPHDIEIPVGKEGFRLEKGGILKQLTVRYELFGTINADRSNVIFICHALTGDAHVVGFRPGENPETGRPSGWWEGMIGPLCGIDTERYCVLCANVLGGCMGTTGPASINPDTGKPYGSQFPEITMGDIVTVHHALLKELQISKLAAVVGGSFGGMQALDWAVRFPDEMERCVIIASAARLNTQALAFDIVGRHAIVQDPAWRDGDYYGKDHPEQGLAAARKLAHITYLSQEVMEDKFGREKREEWISDKNFHQSAKRNFKTFFEIESYLEYQGNKFVKRFDANSYLQLTRALDAFDLEEQFGSLEAALRGVKSRILLVSLSGDWLFTQEQSRVLVKALLAERKQISYCHLDAPAGHDAFLTHIDELKQVVRAFLTATSATDESTFDKEQSKFFIDFTQKIPLNARVLDLGCGDGTLLKQVAIHQQALCTGIEIDLEKVILSLHAGLNVIMENIDTDMSLIPDNIFDVAIISHTIQVLQHPDRVIKQLLRVADSAIIAFPNFAYLPVRLYLMLRGRMPKAKALPYEWYNTPNIHMCTIKDFKFFCNQASIKCSIVACNSSSFLGKILIFFKILNLGADRVIVLLQKENHESGTQ